MKTVKIDGKVMTFHEAHKDLWNWLSKHPGMYKDDYFETHKISHHPMKTCFACECCKWNCNKCPVVNWRTISTKSEQKGGCCFEKHSINGKPIHNNYQLYMQYSNLLYRNRYDEACEIAAEIANLEWEEVEE